MASSSSQGTPSECWRRRERTLADLRRLEDLLDRLHRQEAGAQTVATEVEKTAPWFSRVAANAPIDRREYLQWLGVILAAIAVVFACKQLQVAQQQLELARRQAITESQVEEMAERALERSVQESQRLRSHRDVLCHYGSGHRYRDCHGRRR